MDSSPTSRPATLLSTLVDTSLQVSEQSGRNRKIALMADFLRALAEKEIAIAVAYLTGVTLHGPRGIGWATIRDAEPPTHVDAPELTLIDVDAELDRTARLSGAGSIAERKRVLGSLFARATVQEREFLARMLIGELRQGALEGLMIDAVAAAARIPADTIRRAAMLGGGIAAVAPTALTEGEAGLARYSIMLFQPIAPMLAQPADDIEDAMARFALAALEWKLDGARVQVHKSDGKVRIYSRTGNDVTAAAPEIVERVATLDARHLILDGEAIVLHDNGAPYPFQETMRRFGRVLDIADMRASMPLSVFFFDCLRVDDHDLLQTPGTARFEALGEVLPPPLLIPRLVTSDIAAAQAFYDDAVARGHEGVMVKAPEAAYDPGARSASWLKVKRAHTLDLVVLAAEWGHGRRRGWLSNLHLGARDLATGEYVMLGKTFKGMTDAMLAWQTEALAKLERHRDAYTVYVRPELVVEITFNDLQASPRYPGGLALRFARVKGYRPDKRPEDADTMEAVRAIYSRQASGDRR